MEEEQKKEVEVPSKFKKIIEEIEGMSVLELNELVKVFEEKFGVSTAMVQAAPTAGAAAEDESSGKVSVELTAPGDGKIQVIKVIKEVLELGLKEAKDLVDGAPQMVKEDLKKEDAEELKKKLEEAGATVTLK